MNTSLSLRVRLTVLILAPLLLVAAVVGGWAYVDAQRNAAERFDTSLLSTALAISRDTAASGGDALSEETRDQLRDTSGGQVFYHVYAPDGVFVTGYATPPVPPQARSGDEGQMYYDAVYLGEAVRALRIAQQANIDGLSGLFTFTVWQATTVRDGYVRSRTIPVFVIITSLIGALAIIVWFGVARGLAPLVSLEEAIARRSVNDLSPIKRSIPYEVKGIVGRFNALLTELSASISAKDAFISDAAHQLRNPIAGVVALADSVVNAKAPKDARERAGDLREAAQGLGHLTNSLLTLERLKAASDNIRHEAFDAGATLGAVVQRTQSAARERGIEFQAELPGEACHLFGDVVMFEQALSNLLDNALIHGGGDLTTLRLAARRTGQRLEVTVADNGKGIPPSEYGRALGRFSQVGPSTGSGLGLPIAEAVAQSFDGALELLSNDGWFCVRLNLPLSPAGSSVSDA